MQINEMQKEVHRIAADHGWWEDWDRNVGEMLSLIHSEISEALEEWRRHKALDEIYYSDGGKPEGFPIELADAIIRIGDLCERYGIDLEEALRIKMAFNESRPYRHGGLKA
jgi:NTP pyrophosphatase (non-canonical NTP hydrolase)